MIDIKEHVRQEFLQAFGEEKGTYWYVALTEARDNLIRCQERVEELAEAAKVYRDSSMGTDRGAGARLNQALARLEGDQ